MAVAMRTFRWQNFLMKTLQKLNNKYSTIRQSAPNEVIIPAYGKQTICNSRRHITATTKRTN